MKICTTTFGLALLLTAAALGLMACSNDDSTDESSNSSSSSSTSQPTSSGTGNENKKDVDPAPKRGPGEPDRITVQMMVLPCAGSRLGLDAAKPSVDDAMALAASLKSSLENEDEDAAFGSLASQYSVDPDYKKTKGLRVLTNWGVAPDLAAGERPRAATPALADKAFKLEVGKAEIVPFDAEKNPLGVLLFKRTK